MPTRYAHPMRHVQYKRDIRRKGMHETEMIWESEVAVPPKVQLSLTPIHSPVSVADFYMPEIKALSLPDSWTVVGRNGKSLKGKMYDEPAKKKKKKKRKTKVKAVEEDIVDVLADLEEVPSTSKAIQEHDWSAAKLSKAMAKAKEAKFWAHYRDGKEVASDARDALHAIFSVTELTKVRAAVGLDVSRLERRVEMMEEQMTTHAQETVARQAKEKRKSRKGDSLKEKTRRRARSDAMAATCGMLEMAGDDDKAVGIVVFNPTARQTKLVPHTTDVNGVFWSLADVIDMRPPHTHKKKRAAKKGKGNNDKRKMPEEIMSGGFKVVTEAANNKAQSAKKVKKQAASPKKAGNAKDAKKQACETM